MKDKYNYVLIQWWMVEDLGLKGIDLMVFAIINGFCQDGETVFSGSQRYLAEWCGVSQKTIQRTLNSLVNNDLIEREELKINGVVFYRYRTIKCPPPGQNVHTPLDKMSTNNTSNINKDIKEKVLLHNTKESFIPPSVEEVNNYVNNMDYHFNPEEFVAYYESVGWKVGNKPMKSWQACCRTWEVNWKAKHKDDKPVFKYNEREL